MSRSATSAAREPGRGRPGGCGKGFVSWSGYSLLSLDHAVKKPQPREGTINTEWLLGMIIDEASIADAETIATIHVAARQRAMPWLPALHTTDQVRLYFETMVLPIEKVLVAREGLQNVGFISVNQGWLNHLYITPDHWGVGLGAKLLDAARADADYLQLWVFQRNTSARRFYSRRGFCEREVTDGQENEEKEPDIRMDWVRRN